MRRFIRSLFIAATVLLTFAQISVAQGTRQGSVFVPQSSVEHSGDIGVRFHTNIMIKVVHGSPEQGTLLSNPAATGLAPAAAGLPPFPGAAFETPASLGCVYQLVSTIVAGCNPNTVIEHPHGGSRTIAIVDAYDDPNAASDLSTFSSQFGLPAASFSVVYASGTQPAQDPTGGWEVEESLDIEMAHAMAPRANIILVEAASNSATDLFGAVTLAGSLVAAAGGGEVSITWGGSEFLGEASNDPVFTAPGVVYIVSTGDISGTLYPSVSPNVIAAGGATVRRVAGGPFFGNLKGQSVWQETGGGPSLFEPTPAFQDAIEGGFPFWAQGSRGVPDLSFDSDPDTGVWFYDSIPISGVPNSASNWYIGGGTSVAAPALAGIINVAGHFSSSSARELTRIYNHGTFTSDYLDIASGDCGPYDGFSAKAGWDYCTGVGTPIGYGGK
jgi:kumamolisin